MLESKEENVVRLEDEGIVLRRKGPGQVWTARITIRAGGRDHGRVERSTGERDLALAQRRAIRIAGEFDGVTKVGRSPFSRTVGAIATEYLSALEQAVEDEPAKQWKLERHRIVIENSILPSLGDHKIDGLKKADLLNLQKWRKLRHKNEGVREIRYQRGNKWIKYSRDATKPSPETLRKEAYVLQAVLAYAVEQGYVVKEQLPDAPVVDGPSGQRAAFTREQLKLIQEKSIERMLAQENLMLRKRWFSLHLRMLWIYLSGCRPQEIANLRWADVLIGEDISEDNFCALKITPEHSKKKVQPRFVIPLPELATVVWETINIKRYADPSEFVIAKPDGSQVGKVAKSFKNLLRDVVAMTRRDRQYGEAAAARLFADDFLSKTLYSLRHSFITERLEESMEIGRLARWVGTSVAMIEEYYGKPKVHKEIIQELQDRAWAAKHRERKGSSYRDLLARLIKLELDRPVRQFSPVYVPLPQNLLDSVQAEDGSVALPFEDEPELTDEEYECMIKHMEREGG